MRFEVIQENQDWLAIVKPCSQEFHGEDGTLNLLRKEHDEVHGVHRLDKETSGLMLFAKNKVAQKKLSQLFESKEIVKVYAAIASGKPTKKQGMVTGDLIKSRGGSYRLARSIEKPSKTRFISFRLEEGIRGLLLKPITGYTHQLRVVCKSLGCPILGDSRYGGAKAPAMHLHASHLRFKWKDQFIIINHMNQSLDLFDQHQARFGQELEKFMR